MIWIIIIIIILILIIILIKGNKRVLRDSKIRKIIFRIKNKLL